LKERAVARQEAFTMEAARETWMESRLILIARLILIE